MAHLRSVGLRLGIVASWVLAGACGSSTTNGFTSGTDGGSNADGQTKTPEGGATKEGGSTGHEASVTPTDDAGTDAGHDSGSQAEAGPKGDATTDAPKGDAAADAVADATPPVDAPPDVNLDSGTLTFDGPIVDSGLPQVAIVYGHSATTLYSVDPNTKAVTTVADFTGCDSSVIDIALDKTSTMYATTFGGVYTIDTTTAACTLIASGSYPNSLSFVPAGTVDPLVEALVGYNGGSYVRIDTTSGALTTIGSLGGNGYSSSGDIVSVIGGGTYLTVTGGSDCDDNDCLVEVNPTTGALVKNYGSVGYSEVFGLAFWAGTVYGFDNAGDLFQVVFPSGGGITVTDIPIPSAPADLSFYGAGSTTAAPRN